MCGVINFVLYSTGTNSEEPKSHVWKILLFQEPVGQVIVLISL